jgi:hypothetical protein
MRAHGDLAQGRAEQAGAVGRPVSDIVESQASVRER